MLTLIRGRKQSFVKLNEGSMLTTGVFQEISSYYPSEGKVLMNYRSEKPCFIPLYSVEEMQETAENLLAGIGGEEAEK